jgi:uncharacterized protein YndB with AHSA1/START domain
MRGGIEMAKMEASVVIARPIEEVFAYVVNASSWPKWEQGLLEAEQTSEGPIGVGTTFRGLNEFMGRKMEWTSEITEYEPNEKVAQKMISGPVQGEQSLTFEPVEDRTRFTLVSEGETGGFFKVAEPIVNRMMKKQLEGNLAKLKQILEAGA